jgi:heptosyltransferase II
MAQQVPTSGMFTRAGQFIVYLLFRAVEGVLALVPIGVCARIGRALGGGAFYLFRGHRKLALRNLEIAFGREKDLAWRRQTARAHFKSLGGNLVCSLKLPLMSREDVLRRVTPEGMEHAAAVGAAGKPVVFGVCHLSCWELLTQIPSLLTVGRKLASIYQPLANPWLDAHVKRRREKLGYALFDRSKGFSGPMKHLREEKGVIGVLVDQHAGDKGLWCPFFDRLASTSNLAALMALRCDTPLLPLAVYDDGPGRWRLVGFPPVNSRETKPTAEGITAMMNLAVEVMIRRAPENWFWVHNRWKTPKPDFILAHARRGVTLPAGYDARRLQPFHLLVRSPNWLGDACMALPAVRALKSGRPDLKLTALTPAKLGDLWKMIPEVDSVILKESKEGTGSVAAKVRASGPFDAAVLFANSVRTALEVWRAGVPRIVGFRGSMRSGLLDQVVPEPGGDRPPLHHARRYLLISKHGGAQADDPALLAAPARENGSSGPVAICAGAEYGPAKRWPLERFAEVANRVSARMPELGWLLVGAPGEKEMGARLAALMGRIPHQNLVGQTSLAELIERLRGCRLLLTNDTGTMHLAAALGVPTLSIFGSTEPVLTGPTGANHRIVRHHVPCSPCFERECPFGHYDCLTGVTVERVAAEMTALLTSPAPRAG